MLGNARGKSLAFTSLMLVVPSNILKYYAKYVPPS